MTVAADRAFPAAVAELVMCLRATALVAVTCFLLGCTATTDHKIPARPLWPLPDSDSPFWEDKANWPHSLTNQGVVYRLQITYLVDGREAVAESFADVKDTSAEIREARYSVDIFSFSRLPDPNSGQIGYGPKFSWRADGTIRQKGFRYENGLWMFVSYDRAGKAWWKSFTDYKQNETIWILYDRSGNIIGYLKGRHTDDAPYRGQDTIILDGKPATESEFYDRLRALRRERDT